MSQPTETKVKPTATIAYKTDPITIEYDLYSPTTKSDKPGSLIVFFHAGAAYFGNKKLAFPEWYLEGLNKRGWTIISANYRVRPEATGHEMMTDLKDLWS